MNRPLLVVDGDSLAHRAYHGLPKSVNLNAVVGFTKCMAATRPASMRVAFSQHPSIAWRPKSPQAT